MTIAGETGCFSAEGVSSFVNLSGKSTAVRPTLESMPYGITEGEKFQIFQVTGTETKNVILCLCLFFQMKGVNSLAEGKKTPLYDMHVQHGGRMVEFSGWLLPVQYSGILEEHRAVREHAGIFDVSHMGEFIIEGNDALDFLQKLVTNDVSKMVPGQVQYTPMCYQDGGTVDDLLIYYLGKDKFMLVVNAANIEKDWAWAVDNAKGFNVNLTDISNQTAEIALQGPAAEKILAKLTNAALTELGYYRFMTIQVADKRVLISRTGYTGEDGFEVYCKNEDVVYLWKEILNAGKEYNLLPCGLGARDTLRFEACLPLYGHELSPSISPLNAGLGKFVALDKQEFNGKTALGKQKSEGLEKKIVGFCVTGKGIARADYEVAVDQKVIGRVTSGSFAPTIGKNLGLAIIESSYAKLGSKINIVIREKEVSAEIIKKPFYIRKGK